MSKKGKSTEGQCAYCNNKENLTKDHIPPKNLFFKPRPGNLITVPSCLECNHQASMDDEYFRMIITTRECVAGNTEAQRLWPAILRSLSKPQKAEVRGALFENSSHISDDTIDYVHLTKEKHDINITRLDRVAIRITKGLFLHEQSYRLPESHEAAVCLNPVANREGEPELEEITEIKEQLLSQPLEQVGNGVFSYRFYFNDDRNISFWLLTFFESLSFICQTALRYGFIEDQRGLNPPYNLT